MKVKNLAWAILAVLAFGFVSCEENEKETKYYSIDFEDVTLGENGYWNGSDLSGEAKEEPDEYNPENTITNYYGTITSGIIKLDNKFTPNDWGGSWKGFACSNLTDTISGGYENQYCVMDPRKDKNQFALLYEEGTIRIPKNEYGYFKAESIELANSTWVYYYMKESFNEDHYLGLIVKGLQNGVETGTAKFNLTSLADIYYDWSWSRVDLSRLGEVDELQFSFETNDTGEHGPNAPLYACIDNIIFSQEVAK